MSVQAWIFLISIVVSLLLLRPAAVGVRRLYVDAKRGGGRDLSRALYYAILGMGFNGVFWLLLLGLAAILPETVRETDLYKYILVVVAAAGILTPAAIVNRWWQRFEKTTKRPTGRAK